MAVGPRLFDVDLATLGVVGEQVVRPEHRLTRTDVVDHLVVLLHDDAKIDETVTLLVGVLDAHEDVAVDALGVHRSVVLPGIGAANAGCENDADGCDGDSDACDGSCATSRAVLDDVEHVCSLGELDGILLLGMRPAPLPNCIKLQNGYHTSLYLTVKLLWASTADCRSDKEAQPQ